LVHVLVLFFDLDGKYVNWQPDWDLAIKHNSEALKGIVVALFAMLGLSERDKVSRIPPSLHQALLRVLRPAESAVRRLIVIVARGLAVKPRPSRPMPKGIIRKGEGSFPSFRLTDPRKRFPELRQGPKFTRNPPRIHVFGNDPRVVALWPTPRPSVDPPPPPDGLVNAERISRRLQALKSALEDLPRQAKRLARWRMRREASKTPTFKSPLRPGRPPGSRRRHIHDVDDILDDLHGLAWEAMKPDTS
jgi:hypothetical protein